VNGGGGGRGEKGEKDEKRDKKDVCVCVLEIDRVCSAMKGYTSFEIGGGCAKAVYVQTPSAYGPARPKLPFPLFSPLFPLPRHPNQLASPAPPPFPQMPSHTHTECPSFL
jgi:hypothetical protein